MHAIGFPTFERACELARARSIEFACTVHVNAVVELRNGQPVVAGCRVDDWYNSDCTVASYTNGK